MSRDGGISCIGGDRHRRRWWATRDLGRHTLAQWDGPPLIVIRPEVHVAHPIRGGDPARLIAAGYEAARSVLARWDGLDVSIGGVYPSM
jgi:hypothetical protein